MGSASAPPAPSHQVVRLHVLREVVIFAFSVAVFDDVAGCGEPGTRAGPNLFQRPEEILHGHHAHVAGAHGVHHRVFDGTVNQVGQVGTGESIGALDEVAQVDAFDGAGLEVVVEDCLSGGAVGG